MAANRLLADVTKTDEKIELLNANLNSVNMTCQPH